MTEKLVLFTFDYELFLGARSGRVHDCLIEPTGRMLTLLSEAGFKAVFFVDTVYLLRLQEIAPEYSRASGDLAVIFAQLKEIVSKGNYIFPHIHAHWLDAEYISSENEWSLLNKRYFQFNSLPTQQRKYLFDASVQLISSLACEVNKDYKIDSYRAGGWSIQPFDCFKPLFLEHGIKHEWSVLPGKFLFSDAHAYDFRKAPARSPVYRFSNDECKEDEAGPFTQWTISLLPLTHFERWLNFKISGLLKRMKMYGQLKGSTVNTEIFNEGDVLLGKYAKRLNASFEGLNPLTLRKYLWLLRNVSYFQFISHPKLLTCYEFKMIRKLFKELKDQYPSVETDFRKVCLNDRHPVYCF